MVLLFWGILMLTDLKCSFPLPFRTFGKITGWWISMKVWDLIQELDQFRIYIVDCKEGGILDEYGIGLALVIPITLGRPMRLTQIWSGLGSDLKIGNC